LRLHPERCPRRAPAPLPRPVRLVHHEGGMRPLRARAVGVGGVLRMSAADNVSVSDIDEQVRHSPTALTAVLERAIATNDSVLEHAVLAALGLLGIVVVDRRSLADALALVGTDERGLAVGDRVRHELFGTGLVRRVSGSGQRARAVVRFTDGIERELILEHAGLRLLDEEGPG